MVVTAPMKGETALEIKEQIWSKWIPYFGIPRDLHSDQGANVDGNTVKQLCDFLGVTKTRSSPYHPEGNGLAERSISSIKTLISSACQSRNLSVDRWDEVIDECTLAHNNISNQSSGFSPMMQLFGRNTRMPIDNIMNLPVSTAEPVNQKLVHINSNLNQMEARKKYKTVYDKGAVGVSFEVGDPVLPRRTFGAYPKILNVN